MYMRLLIGQDFLKAIMSVETGDDIDGSDDGETDLEVPDDG